MLCALYTSNVMNSSDSDKRQDEFGSGGISWARTSMYGGAFGIYITRGPCSRRGSLPGAYGAMLWVGHFPAGLGAASVGSGSSFHWKWRRSSCYGSGRTEARPSGAAPEAAPAAAPPTVPSSPQLAVSRARGRVLSQEKWTSDTYDRCTMATALYIRNRHAPDDAATGSSAQPACRCSQRRSCSM